MDLLQAKAEPVSEAGGTSVKTFKKKKKKILCSNCEIEE